MSDLIRTFQKMLTDGVDISWMGSDCEKHDKAWLVGLANLDNNDWLAVNQFTVVEDKRERRPDVVLFVNGLPLAVIELKNAADEKATIRHAYNQLQTYKDQIPLRRFRIYVVFPIPRGPTMPIIL